MGLRRILLISAISERLGMKNKRFTLSMFSAWFLASGVLATQPEGGSGTIVTATTDLTVNQYSALEFYADDPKTFSGRINSGDVVATLNVKLPGAPEGIKVAIAGDRTPISRNGSTVTVETETGGLAASLDNTTASYVIKEAEYLPSRANRSAGSSAIIVDGDATLIFRATGDYTPPPGTYSYSFVAQAFFE
ncbi:hypothetical protein LH23_20395 [Cedecea neteri]|uniref:Uncharacterized protein n=2 Tax=Cedecea neteri TaxID=158822 RepID=A0AAN0S7E6_9ENTR|nr:hypothetical protein LH23_20395 [Cedecea neteri]